MSGSTNHRAAKPRPGRVGGNMLLRLLRVHLAPYRNLLIAVGLFQAAQSIASLYLPSLVGDIIDNGVAVGDVQHILPTGIFVLGITLVQVACAGRSSTRSPGFPSERSRTSEHRR